MGEWGMGEWGRFSLPGGQECPRSVRDASLDAALRVRANPRWCWGDAFAAEATARFPPGPGLRITSSISTRAFQWRPTSPNHEHCWSNAQEAGGAIRYLTPARDAEIKTAPARRRTSFHPSHEL